MPRSRQNISLPFRYPSVTLPLPSCHRFVTIVYHFVTISLPFRYHPLAFRCHFFTILDKNKFKFCQRITFREPPAWCACGGCLRRFGDLRKNMHLDFWSMCVMSSEDFPCVFMILVSSCRLHRNNHNSWCSLLSVISRFSGGLATNCDDPQVAMLL